MICFWGAHERTIPFSIRDFSKVSWDSTMLCGIRNTRNFIFVASQTFRVFFPITKSIFRGEMEKEPRKLRLHFPIALVSRKAPAVGTKSCILLQVKSEMSSLGNLYVNPFSSHEYYSFTKFVFRNQKTRQAKVFISKKPRIAWLNYESEK